MGKKKAGKYKKKDDSAPARSSYYFDADDESMMNDEIDAFHKQRDVVPLDVNEDVGESDEDTEHPVFDLEDDKEDDQDDEDADDDDDDDDDDEDIDDDSQLTGIAAKISRQQKYLQAKMGGAEDEMDEGAEEEEKRRTVWSTKKGLFYDADNADFELQSSDEESPAEEEAEVLRLLKEKAKSLSMEDFGLEDISEDERDSEPTIEETLAHGKPASKASGGKEPKGETGNIYEEVRKDLNALTREEQMDVVYSSAPELVGLLSELNYAFEELENKVNPLLSKIVEGKDAMKGGLHYLEVKQLLLLLYCQAITFYLLLKSEGRSARDHPVISQLVEIKTLLDKLKELDGNLPGELEDITNKNIDIDGQMKLVVENSGSDSDSLARGPKSSIVSAENGEMTEPYRINEVVDVTTSKDSKKNGSKRKHQDHDMDHDIGPQSMAMLKVRAALEERLKQKGVFTSLAQKNDRVKKHQQSMNGQLETLDDFDDDAMGGNASARPSKVSHLVTAQGKKPKLISGDDDLPKRDDIGERRRKHELRVLARAGIESIGEAQDELSSLASDGVAAADHDVDSDSESDFEFYKQVERQHAAKVAAKADLYSRPSKVPSLPESIVDGKRQITYQMEKNRGLTRSRKKLTKNPRKKYRLQHEKAVTRRKGQVREQKHPSGPYGGESSGINAGISRSVRFKN